MKLFKYFIPMLPLLAAGCAGLTEQQASVPVYPPPYKKPVPQQSKPIAKAKPSIPTSPSEPAPPPTWARPAEKTQSTRLSPVAVAMISDADRSSGAGNLDSAASVLERGLRIEPRNATLIYKLAEVRLKQSNPKLAEDLAKKSALLAGSDNALKKRCWLLIAQARKMQGDRVGANKALLKAEDL